MEKEGTDTRSKTLEKTYTDIPDMETRVGGSSNIRKELHTHSYNATYSFL